MAFLSVQMATMFLFSVGFRTKKALRGNAADWFDVLGPYLKVSRKVRFWFATYALFRDSCRYKSKLLSSVEMCNISGIKIINMWNKMSYFDRIGEYLLECPSTEVRATFCKILVHLAHYSKGDGVYIPSLPILSLCKFYCDEKPFFLKNNIFISIFSSNCGEECSTLRVHFGSCFESLETRRFRIWKTLGSIFYILPQLR